MTPRKDDFDARKDKVLALTIEQYIRTVAPVSSAFLAHVLPYDLSSATIRNILAELEEDGYLTHPHTSSGRIPTQKGYRYYVDHLMNEIQLLTEEKSRIRLEYEKEKLELEHLLEKASRVLSDVTHYTTIISVDGWGNKLFCQGTNYVVEYPDYKDVQRIRKILLALDEKQRLIQIINQNLENRIDVLIGDETRFDEIKDCSLVISPYQMKDGHSGRLAVLGPTRMDYEKVVSTLNYFRELIENDARF